MQPCALLEGKHEGVHAREKEVKPQGPEGKVSEEAERLADSGFTLLDLIGIDVDVLQAECCCIGCKPGVGYDNGREAVYAEQCSDACQDEW